MTVKHLVRWAQQDLNLRPLGDHSAYYGVSHTLPELRGYLFDDAPASPDITGNSDGKVTRDLGPRINPLNWRTILAGFVSCAIVASVVAGVAGWVS